MTTITQPKGHKIVALATRTMQHYKAE